MTHENKILGEGLTYDDVLLVPAFSGVLPREVSIQTKFTRNITINVPIVSAAMDTVTEAALAIAMAREGGIGVLHKNMSIEQQALEVRKVKRAESGMILDPVTLPLTATVFDAKANMREHSIGGIPIVDELGILKGIVTNRDLRFEHDDKRPIIEVMTNENLITADVGTSLKDAEKISSQFMQKFLPKTGTTDLIGNLRLIKQGIESVREEADAVSQYNSSASLVESSEEVGKSFMNVGSSVAALFGGDFASAQDQALKSQNALNKLKNDNIKDSMQGPEILEAEKKLQDDLIALGKTGQTQLDLGLDTLVAINDLELSKKETIAQTNALKKVEKSILGKSLQSSVIANTVLDNTLQLRKDEAFTA